MVVGCPRYETAEIASDSALHITAEKSCGLKSEMLPSIKCMLILLWFRLVVLMDRKTLALHLGS
jgi:hypothetical protein